MAKEPDDRYTTCAALIAAAEEAFGLRRSPLCSAAGVASSLPLRRCSLRRRGCSRPCSRAAATARRPPPVRHGQTRSPASTLRRTRSPPSIDVGASPSATAAGGRSVWVYNHDGPSVSEIDAATNRVRHTTTARPRAPPTSAASRGRCSQPTRAGAWFVGVGPSGQAVSHEGVLGGAREARVPPRARAAGGRGRRTALSGSSFRAHATTSCCASTLPPATSRDGRTSPPRRRSTRSPPASARLGRRLVDAGRSTGSTLAPPARRDGSMLGKRARPTRVVLGWIWVGRSDVREVTRSIVDPRTLQCRRQPCCCPPDGARHARGTARSGAYDTPTGSVFRRDGDHQAASAHPRHELRRLRRAVPDLDRGRRRCHLGDGRRELGNFQLLTAGLAASRPQPTLSPPQPRRPRSPPKLSSDGGGEQ